MKNNLLEKVLYVLCIIIALVVMVLSLLSVFDVIDSVTKINTVLLNIELIILGICSWKKNRTVSIVSICIAIILIIITLI